MQATKKAKRPNQFRGNQAFIGVYQPRAHKESKRVGFTIIDRRAGFLGGGNQAQRRARATGFHAMRDRQTRILHA